MPGARGRRIKQAALAGTDGNAAGIGHNGTGVPTADAIQKLRLVAETYEVSTRTITYADTPRPSLDETIVHLLRSTACKNWQSQVQALQHVAKNIGSSVLFAVDGNSDALAAVNEGVAIVLAEIFASRHANPNVRKAVRTVIVGASASSTPLLPVTVGAFQSKISSTFDFSPATLDQHQNDVASSETDSDPTAVRSAPNHSTTKSIRMLQLAEDWDTILTVALSDFPLGTVCVQNVSLHILRALANALEEIYSLVTVAVPAGATEDASTPTAVDDNLTGACKLFCSSLESLIHRVLPSLATRRLPTRPAAYPLCTDLQISTHNAPHNIISKLVKVLLQLLSCEALESVFADIAATFVACLAQMSSCDEMANSVATLAIPTHLAVLQLVFERFYTSSHHGDEDTRLECLCGCQQKIVCDRLHDDLGCYLRQHLEAVPLPIVVMMARGLLSDVPSRTIMAQTCCNALVPDSLLGGLGGTRTNLTCQRVVDVCYASHVLLPFLLTAAVEPAIVACAASRHAVVQSLGLWAAYALTHIGDVIFAGKEQRVVVDTGDGSTSHTCSGSLPSDDASEAGARGSTRAMRNCVHVLYAVVWDHWDDPIDRVRHAVAKLFDNTLSLHLAITTAATGGAVDNPDPPNIPGDPNNDNTNGVLSVADVTSRLIQAVKGSTRGAFVCLGLLVARVGVSLVLQLDPDLIQDLVGVFTGPHSIATVASTLIVSVVKAQLREHSGSVRVGGDSQSPPTLEKDHTTGNTPATNVPSVAVLLQPVAAALKSDDAALRQRVGDLLLPRLFRSEPASVDLLQSMLVDAIDCDSLTDTERATSITALLKVLTSIPSKLSSSHRIPEGKSALGDFDERHFGRAAWQSDPEVRLDILSWICERKGVKLDTVSTAQYDAVKLILQLNMTSQSPGFRGRIAGSIKKFVDALGVGLFAATKAHNRDVANATASTEQQRNLPPPVPVQRCVDFLAWLWCFCIQSLGPGLVFQRKSLALAMLDLLLALHTHAHADTHAVLPVTRGVARGDMIVVVRAIGDPFDTNRNAALSLLLRYRPVLCHGFSEQHFFEAHMDAHRLSKRSIVADVAQSALLYRFVFAYCAGAPTTTVVCDSVADSSGLNKATPNVDNTQSCVPMFPTQSSTCWVLQALTAELRKRISIARDSLLRCSKEAPLYATLQAIRCLLVDLDLDITGQNTPVDQVEKWRQWVEQLLECLHTVVDLTCAVVANAYPEGMSENNDDAVADDVNEVSDPHTDDTDNNSDVPDSASEDEDSEADDDNRVECVMTDTPASDAAILHSRAVLICCWRSMKEVALIIDTIFRRIPFPTHHMTIPTHIGQPSVDGVDKGVLIASAHGDLSALHASVLTVETVVRTSVLLKDLLCTARHRGAVDMLHTGFQTMCQRLWAAPRLGIVRTTAGTTGDAVPDSGACGGGDSDGEVPQHDPDQLRRLPQQWLDWAFREIMSLDADTVTRRSAGFPALFQSILAGAPARGKDNSHEVISTTLATLVALAVNHGNTITTRTHALNILRVLMRDTRFGVAVHSTVAPAMVLAVDGFATASFAIRNSSMMLLSALCGRIFGCKKVRDEHANDNKLMAREFFSRYPSLFEEFVVRLQFPESGKAPGSGLHRTGGTLRPRVYPILVVLSRLRNISDGLNAQNAAVLQRCMLVCAASPQYQCASRHAQERCLAARVLTAMIVPGTAVAAAIHCIHTLANTPDANTFHGIAVQVQCIHESLLLVHDAKLGVRIADEYSDSYLDYATALTAYLRTCTTVGSVMWCPMAFHVLMPCLSQSLDALCQRRISVSARVVQHLRDIASSLTRVLASFDMTCRSDTVPYEAMLRASITTLLLTSERSIQQSIQRHIAPNHNGSISDPATVPTSTASASTAPDDDATTSARITTLMAHPHGAVAAADFWTAHPDVFVPIIPVVAIVDTVLVPGCSATLCDPALMDAAVQLLHVSARQAFARDATDVTALCGTLVRTATVLLSDDVLGGVTSCRTLGVELVGTALHGIGEAHLTRVLPVPHANASGAGLSDSGDNAGYNHGAHASAVVDECVGLLLQAHSSAKSSVERQSIARALCNGATIATTVGVHRNETAAENATARADASAAHAMVPLLSTSRQLFPWWRLVLRLACDDSGQTRFYITKCVEQAMHASATLSASTTTSESRFTYYASTPTCPTGGVTDLSPVATLCKAFALLGTLSLGKQRWSTHFATLLPGAAADSVSEISNDALHEIVREVLCELVLDGMCAGDNDADTRLARGREHHQRRGKVFRTATPDPFCEDALVLQLSTRFLLTLPMPHMKFTESISSTYVPRCTRVLASLLADIRVECDTPCDKSERGGRVDDATRVACQRLASALVVLTAWTPRVTHREALGSTPQGPYAGHVDGGDNASESVPTHIAELSQQWTGVTQARQYHRHVLTPAVHDVLAWLVTEQQCCNRAESPSIAVGASDDWHACVHADMQKALFWALPDIV